MMDRRAYGREAGLAVKFALVGLVGFMIDAVMLRAGLWVGLTPAVARAVSIATAMQVTFLINGLFIFRCLTRRTCAAHWARYMATNGAGNLCSYLIFVTLISLHAGLVSRPWFAFPASTAAAYVINYAGARVLVFGGALRRARAADDAL